MIRVVGVLGVGQMGSGIAHVSALSGFEVRMLDLSHEIIDRATASIDRDMTRRLARGTLSEAEKNSAMARLRGDVDYAVFSDCDLVIEAVTEDEATKRGVFAKLCPVLPPDAIIASNTSSISITRMATTTDRPRRFIGLHFMNPVPVMRLVEMIRGIATAERTTEEAGEFVAKLGKTAVPSEDFPAFITSRLMLSLLNEAVFILHEGVGTVEAIDVAMRLGANHPMGPLELADFIGLDTCLSVMRTLHEGLADTKYRPCPLLVKYVEAGWLGRKTGRGFYDYSGETPVPTR
ncbi:MAG: 3-hydroxybutyryl-CoA dehydrogenase [Alphaproteobacteria bacterium]|nr:3-hydroxybutyryl-CoA dehydrogenase [Alphaproteobacteria bacterium]MBF0129068.1 3-hydroxybutyryl-CoA dehydrogenase [Alphaproteobacteria bacterium]